MQLSPDTGYSLLYVVGHDLRVNALMFPGLKSGGTETLAPGTDFVDGQQCPCTQPVNW